MPYFLLGLTTWWKIMPSNITNEQYDKVFLAYMDTTILVAERMHRRPEYRIEAAFFLAFLRFSSCLAPGLSL